jgi:hypothetical protein
VDPFRGVVGNGAAARPILDLSTRIPGGFTMADPTSGGIGKASQQMMQELQKQMQQVEQQQKVNGPQFDQVMSQQGVNDPTKVQDVAKVQDVQKSQSAADVLRTAQAQQVGGVDKSIDVKKVEATTKTEGGLKAVLQQVVEGQNKLDQIIKMATSGKTYGNQELLAIQASVYKFSQELELTSKVVEKATSGVKQTMQTQV